MKLLNSGNIYSFDVQIWVLKQWIRKRRHAGRKFPIHKYLETMIQEELWQVDITALGVVSSTVSTDLLTRQVSFESTWKGMLE
jgi:hypothetical protein